MIDIGNLNELEKLNYVLLIVVLLWNVSVLFLYGADKNAAVKGAWRIQEKTLLLCAFIMGGVGALAGMFLFRHKVRKIKFLLVVPLSIIFNVIVILFYLYYFVGFDIMVIVNKNL